MELQEYELERVTGGKDVAQGLVQDLRATAVSARRALDTHASAMSSVQSFAENANARTESLYGEAKAFIDAIRK